MTETDATREAAPRVWVLADERRGTANQALGVAEALGWPFEEKAIRYSRLAVLPNLILGARLAGLTPASRAALVPPWPQLVIAAGRRVAGAARWIKRRSGNTSVLVQIMFPGAGGRDEFDLVAVPRHDRRTGTNVVQVTGAPHRVTATTLAEAAKAWGDRFADDARPLIGLILGGATRRRPFDSGPARELGRRVGRGVAETGGSVVVTSSRRTGGALDHVLAGLADVGVAPAHVHRWGEGQDENPYPGILALADALVVTGDSVSMVSEACASGKAVYIYAPPGFASDRHARLHRELIDAGYARALEGRIEPRTHSPLNAADDVAAEIRRRFGHRLASS